jgi:hypothetical protein
MVESRPSAKAQKGLDELVAAGFISRRLDRRSGAVEYRPVKRVKEIGRPIAEAFLEGREFPGARFRLVEPIP